MNVVRLNPSTYLADTLIEDYSSMIWTERFLEPGEFEMRTPAVSKVRGLIPEGSLISLSDSTEVMIVETHSIDVDENGDRVLTITGRTLETFLEERVAIPTVYGDTWKTLLQITNSQVSALMLWNYLVNATGQDPTRVGTTKDVSDAVSNLVVTDSTTVAGVVQDWYFSQGVVYSQLRDFLGLGGLGVRGIRPPGTSGKVMSWDTSGGGARGTTSSVQTSNITQLRLDIYNGIDRTLNQGAVEPVIFAYSAGHIDHPKYLFSIRDIKTQAKVISSLQNINVGSATETGFDRRVLLVDGGDQGSVAYDDFLASLSQKGAVELAKYNRKTLFDGAISLLSPYKYKSHYFLGDTVSLIAEYGFQASMTVAEFVRTEDQAGDRGYPTLLLAS